jgi:hypothetical protein
VINDVICGNPVTVTCCTIRDSVRVFTRTDGSSDPLDVAIGGWKDDQLWLHISDTYFPQVSPEIPLEDMTFETTTWNTWKTAHPDTDIFTGRSDAEFSTDGAAYSGDPSD